MSNITKWLAGIAGLLVSFEVAGPTMYQLFFHQLDSQRQALVKVSRQLTVKEKALHQAKLTVRKFEQRAKLNFETDIAKARLSYQEYLLRLSDACALNSVMISSSQPERLDELGHILNFSVQATGTTEQFGKLIDGFYRTEALHRLSHVNIFQSLGPDSPTHSLALDVGLLVLDANANSSETNSSGTLSPPSAHALRDLFGARDIFRKSVLGTGPQTESSLASGMNMISNLFGSLPAAAEAPATPQFAEPPPVPQPIEQPAAPMDPKANLRLVGIIAKGPTKVALFCDVTKDVQYSLAEKSDLREMGIDARITAIDVNDVRLVEDDQSLQLALGELYNAAVKK